MTVTNHSEMGARRGGGGGLVGRRGRRRGSRGRRRGRGQGLRPEEGGAGRENLQLYENKSGNDGMETVVVAVPQVAEPAWQKPNMAAGEERH